MIKTFIQPCDIPPEIFKRFEELSRDISILKEKMIDFSTVVEGVRGLSKKEIFYEIESITTSIKEKMQSNTTKIDDIKEQVI